MLRRAVLCSLIALGGCVLSSSSDGAPEEPGLIAPPSPPPSATTTRGKLERGRTLRILPGSEAEVTATRLWGDELVETATLPIAGGELTVRSLADGRLALDALRLVIGDVQLSAASVPPSGLELTGVQVSVAPLVVPARWSGEEGAAASGTVELLLDWSLSQKPAGSVPMATQHIAAVPLTVDVASEGGRVVAILRAARRGTFFTWGGLMELGDLAVTVEAAE